jgi:flagellar biosynthesis anti-sigma factor FlgM
MMKINRPEIVNQSIRVYKQQIQNKPGAASSAPSDLSKGDSIKISSLSEVLKKEIARLEEGDPARTEKLSRLSRQIEAGDYKIDSKELAALLLKDPDRGGKV